MTVSVPTGLRDAVADGDGGPAWLDSIPARAARAAQRWGLVVGEPFENGMAAWTAPATTAAADDVVLKLSYPHREARDEAAALAAWAGAGVVELLDADAADWALLVRRLRPGSSLRDAHLPTVDHLAVGADLMRRMAAVPVPAGPPFQDLVEVASGLAAIAAERAGRLLPSARRVPSTPVCAATPSTSCARCPATPLVAGSCTATSTPATSSATTRPRPARTASGPGGSRSTRSPSTATWRGGHGRW